MEPRTAPRLDFEAEMVPEVGLGAGAAAVAALEAQLHASWAATEPRESASTDGRDEWSWPSIDPPTVHNIRSYYLNDKK